MIEIKGDLFAQKCDAICITTNGMIKSNGLAVMGAGIALAAAKKFPSLPHLLATSIKTKGNTTQVLLSTKDYDILSLPTKHSNWRDNSDINLVESSIKQLVKIVYDHGWKSIVLTRPGCGNGGLDWSQVKPRVVPLLDDRFAVITP